MAEKTFEKDDRFNRKPFADQLTKAVSTFYQFEEEAYVLSLNAKFGSGKTTFLEMWKGSLEADGFKVIYINAWESDFDNEPIVPIASALIEALSAGNQTKFKSAITALETVIGIGHSVGNQVATHVTGVDPQKTGKQAQTKITDKEFSKLGEEIYKGFINKRDTYSDLKAELGIYLLSLWKESR